MNKKELLLKRLDEIGRSLKKTGKALALLGLGSVGVELDRIDDYSDLDFFVIVKDGEKNIIYPIQCNFFQVVHCIGYIIIRPCPFYLLFIFYWSW